MKLKKMMHWSDVKKAMLTNDDIHIESITKFTKLIANDQTKTSMIVLLDRNGCITHIYKEVEML